MRSDTRVRAADDGPIHVVTPLPRALREQVLPASGAQRGNRIRRELRDKWKFTANPEVIEEVVKPAWIKQYDAAAKKCGHPPGYFKQGKCRRADAEGYCP